MIQKTKRLWLHCAIGTGMALLVTPLMAQADYPNKPVKIIVPYPAGGTTDLIARIVATQLTERLKQSFIVENRAGASGAIGSVAVARSAPDGYTLVMGTASSHGINAALQQNLPYDAIKDFSPVTIVASTPNVFIANANVPVKTLGELISLAKSQPGKINFGSTSMGGTPHMSAELLKAMAGIEMAHVPYKGAAPMLTDLVGGQVQIGVDNLPSSMAFIRSGKVKALAVTTSKRFPSAPDIPTVAESGVAGYEVSGWFGLLAPAGTPRTVVEKIQSAIKEMVQSPEVARQLRDQGAEPVANTPDQFAQEIKADVQKWRKVASTTGVKLE